MLKKIRDVFTLFLFGFLISCGSDSTKDTSDKVVELSIAGNSFKLTSISDDLFNLNVRAQEIEEKRKSSNNFENHSSLQLSSAVDSAQIAVLTLLKYGLEDQEKLNDVFEILGSAIGEYEAFVQTGFTEEDFTKVFARLRELRFSISRLLGVSAEYTWVLYSLNLGAEPKSNFSVFSGKAGRDVVSWVNNFQLNEPSLKVQARGGHSWVTTKSFDLSSIKDPSFRYLNQADLNAPDSKNTVYGILDTVFQTYILLDQAPGEDPETMDSERKIKVNYKVSDFPLRRYFSYDWMPKISLAKYKNHKVSIGLLFDTRKIKEKQYYSWSVSEIELHGAGTL